MAVIDGTDEQPVAPAECWCCGTPADPDRLLRLGNHPEVGVCAPCARWLGTRAGELEDRGRSGALVALRHLLRRARNAVVARGWHHRRFVGPLLHALGRRLP